jgi:hypothetical protein
MKTKIDSRTFNWTTRDALMEATTEQWVDSKTYRTEVVTRHKVLAYLQRSKYTPHQGAQEMARRMK